MKAPVLAATLLVILVASCKQDDATPNGAPTDAATFDSPPGRQVVEDIPDGFFTPRDASEVPPVSTGSPGMGGGGDGSVAVDGAKPADAAPLDLGGETSGSGCDLHQQNCGDSQGCYLGPGGRNVCRLAGGFPEGFDCNQHEDCLPGYLCATGFVGTGTLCLRVCDPRTGSTCPGMKGCRVYPNSQVGTCAP